MQENLTIIRGVNERMLLWVSSPFGPYVHLLPSVQQLLTWLIDITRTWVSLSFIALPSSSVQSRLVLCFKTWRVTWRKSRTIQKGQSTNHSHRSPMRLCGVLFFKALTSVCVSNKIHRQNRWNECKTADAEGARCLLFVFSFAWLACRRSYRTSHSP